jgi:glutathione S-transferase
MVDNILGVLNDVQQDLFTLCFNEKFDEVKEKVFTDKIKPKLDNIQKFLGDKDWLMGYLTLADFKLAEPLNYVEGIWPDHFKEYPKLSVLKSRFNQLPEIQAYYAHEDYGKAPLMPPFAKWH